MIAGYRADEPSTTHGSVQFIKGLGLLSSLRNLSCLRLNGEVQAGKIQTAE